MNERILRICNDEGVTLQDNAMASLAKVSGGDLRKAITTLQSAVRLGGKVSCQISADILASSTLCPEATCL